MTIAASAGETSKRTFWHHRLRLTSTISDRSSNARRSNGTESVMAEAELNKIWDTIASGQTVEGWGERDHGDIHTLRRLRPDELYARKIKDAQVGKWQLLF